MLTGFLTMDHPKVEVGRGKVTTANIINTKVCSLDVCMLTAGTAKLIKI